MRASDWDPVFTLIMFVIIVLAPVWIALAVIAAVLALSAQAIAVVQFLWQLVMSVVQFIQAIPQPVWYGLFFVLGMVAGIWWTQKAWPRVQGRSRELGDNIQKNPLVYLGLPTGCIVLLTCCALTVFAGAQLVNFIQQHVVIR